MKKQIKTSSMIVLFLIVILVVTSSVYAVEITTSENENLNYNRAAARSYALTHYATGTYNSNYHDYNGEGGDCTNFASQVLKAGGMEEIGIIGYLDYANWYYNFKLPTQVSNSWINAQVLKKHWGHDINGVGKNRAYKFKRATINDFLNNPTSTVSLLSTASGGDIFQLTDLNNDSWHTMVVTAYAFHPITGDLDYQYVQHTDNKMGYLTDLLTARYELQQGERDFIAMRIRK